MGGVIRVVALEIILPTLDVFNVWIKRRPNFVLIGKLVQVFLFSICLIYDSFEQLEADVRCK
jgi:hypothetical protein